jgi:probable rRNA maturation factor
MNVDCETLVDHTAWSQALDPEQTVRRVVAVLSGRSEIEGPAYAQASVLFANDERLQELNKTWRQINKPTNVLSFPAAVTRQDQHLDGEPEYIGDIALAFETIEREAKEQSKAFSAHVDHLVIHGILHLLGYDHETDEDAEIMENLEVLILQDMGIANPYK